MLQKLYQLIDSIESLPFVWDDEAYRLHVESVCMALGEYESNTWCIEHREIVGRMTWIVFWERENGYIDRKFDFLSNAVKYFVSQVPRPDLI